MLADLFYRMETSRRTEDTCAARPDVGQSLHWRRVVSTARWTTVAALVWVALALLAARPATAAGISLAASPAVLSASQMTVLTVGASASGGTLSISATAGTLTSDGGLTAQSCGGGAALCTGVSGNGTAQLTIPAAGNDLTTVVLTFTAPPTAGSVAVTASQGGATTTVAVTVRAGEGTIGSGSIPLNGGFGLVVFDGGTFDQLVGAAACPGQVSFWVTTDGQFVLYLPGAPAAVNAPFQSEFTGGVIPAGTPLIGRCEASSGVEGVVTLGPLTPVCVVGQPCDRPYQATLDIEDTSGQLVAETTSDANGSYRVGLRPGTYMIVPLSPPGQTLPRASSVQVDVPSGQFVTVDIAYDSGIR
jgi:hypothetical protein